MRARPTNCGSRMITGVVTPSREAVLSFGLYGSDGHEVEIEAVIDTGFDGFLTLPTRLIQQLRLLDLLDRMAG